MKKQAFKKLSAILAVAMIIAAVAPLSAQADRGDMFTEGNFEYVVENEASGSNLGEVVLYAYNASFDNVVIPATVTNASNGNIYAVTLIASDVFSGKSITSVTIPSTIENIDYRAFFGCASLTNVVFEPGSKLTKIGESAFNACLSLVSINLPDGLEIIYQDAFSVCESLKSIDIPASVKRIQNYAFNGCINLNKITFNSPAAPIVGARVLDGISSPGKIYYPKNGSGYTDGFFNVLFGGSVPFGWEIIAVGPTAQPAAPVNMSANVPEADVTGFGREFSVSGEITNAPGIPESVVLNVSTPSPEFTSNKAANAAYSDAILHGQPVAFSALEVVDAASGQVFALPEGAQAQLKFELGKAFADKAVTISQYDVNGALIERFDVTCDGDGSAVIQTRGLGLFVITREWL